MYIPKRDILFQDLLYNLLYLDLVQSGWEVFNVSAGPSTRGLS